VGANRAEARSGYTDRDFASKNAICLKESREALFWLRVAEAKALGNAQRRSALLKEANELVSIFVTVVRTLQGKIGLR
jgi:four helix bundle protein